MRVLIKPAGIITVVIAIAGISCLAVTGLSNPYVYSLPDSDTPLLVPDQDGKGSKLVNAPGKDRAAGKTETIYDNALLDGWRVGNTAKDVKIDDSTLAVSGTAIAATLPAPTKESGLRLEHVPFDSAPYDRVTMKINGGPKGGQKLKIVGLLRGTERKSISLESLPAGKWQTVTARLADLGVGNKFTMTGFALQNSDGTSGPIHVDDIRLLTPEDKE